MGIRSFFAVRVVTVAVACFVASSAETYYDASSWYNTDGNLALNMPAFQSTTVYSGNAALGNDGGFSRRYWDKTCTHTNERGEAAWWTVDLGATKDVKIVVFTPRDEKLGKAVVGTAVLTYEIHVFVLFFFLQYIQV